MEWKKPLVWEILLRLNHSEAFASCDTSDNGAIDEIGGHRPPRECMPFHKIHPLLSILPALSSVVRRAKCVPQAIPKFKPKLHTPVSLLLGEWKDLVGASQKVL